MPTRAIRAGQQDQVTIYALFDPRTGVVRYIGQTGQPLARRLQNHVAEARSAHAATQRNARKCAWIAELLDCGLVPEIAELQTVPRAKANLVERRYIARSYGGTSQLLNRAETPGTWCDRSCADHGHALMARVGHDAYSTLRLAAAANSETISNLLGTIVEQWLETRK